MPNSKIKRLDDKAYENYIKELVGEELVDILPPQKKD